MTSILRDCAGSWLSATDPVKFYNACSKAVNDNSASTLLAGQLSFFAGKKVAPAVITHSAAALAALPIVAYGVAKTTLGVMELVKEYKQGTYVVISTSAIRGTYDVTDSDIHKAVRRIFVGAGITAVSAFAVYKFASSAANLW